MKSKLEDVVAGVSLDGPDPGGPVEVVAVTWHGTQAITVALKNADGINEQMLFRSDEGTFRVLESTARRWSFDGDGELLELEVDNPWLYPAAVDCGVKQFVTGGEPFVQLSTFGFANRRGSGVSYATHRDLAAEKQLTKAFRETFFERS